MKNRLIIVALFMVPFLSYAQHHNYDDQSIIYSSGGNVGIGTTSPAANLHIFGNNSQHIINSGNSGGTARLTISAQGNSIDGRGWHFIHHHHDHVDSYDLLLGFGTMSSTHSNANFRIKTRMDQPDRLTIRNNGNVGIGITNPTHKLTVDGVISAREVKVSNTPNSDYVFEPDYPLLPLSEVETHIKEKKHLPGIPSAEEFKQNGVGLGEMDDMLLRKVEELVLYTIEQQKELEKLKREMENLKQDNVIYKNKNEQQSEFIKQQSELINVLIESKN